MTRNREKMIVLKIGKEMQKNMERRDTKQISNIEKKKNIKEFVVAKLS